MSKIAHISVVHPYYDTRISYRMSQMLSANYDVHLYIPQADKLEITSISKHSVALIKNLFLRLIFIHTSLFFRIVKGKYKLLHFHDPELLPMASLFSFLGKKVVFDVHENLPEQFQSKKFGTFSWRIFNFFKKHFSSKINWVIAEESYSSWLNKPITCILNYADFNSLTPFINDVRSGNKFFYVGGISEKRGLLLFEKVLKTLKSKNIEAEIHLFGRIYDHHITALKNEEIGLFYHGEKTLKEAAEFSKNCIAGLAILLPDGNYNQSFPTKAFEYVALKLPIIISNFDYYQSLFSNEKAISVNPESELELENAMVKILNEPEMAKIMSENAYQFGMKNFNWNTELKKLIDLYLKLGIEFKNGH